MNTIRFDRQTRICLRIADAEAGRERARDMILMGLEEGGRRRLRHHMRRKAMLLYALRQEFLSDVKAAA